MRCGTGGARGSAWAISLSGTDSLQTASMWRRILASKRCWRKFADFAVRGCPCDRCSVKQPGLTNAPWHHLAAGTRGPHLFSRLLIRRIFGLHVFKVGLGDGCAVVQAQG
jgi:hypothetical protein